MSERSSQAALFVLVLLLGWWVGQVSSQPAPLVPVDQGWALFADDNQVRWYIRESALMVIQEIPEEKANQLGYRCRLHVGTSVIRTKLTADQVRRRLMVGED